MEIQLLDVWDYIIIAVLLTVSAVFGLYHGFIRVKETSFLEYTLASRQVGTFPIAVSSFATLVGSGMLIGSPAETYMYGSQATTLALAAFIIAPIMSYVIIPVYRNLSCTSIFQFFELRYNVGFKNLITGFFFITAIGFCSVTMYGPATVLSLVTGINVWIVVIFMDALCMVYTILGGMRAVIYADVIQGMFMLVTVIALVIVGCFHVGGLEEVWIRNVEGNRMEFFNFSLDPTIRHTFWSSLIGWAFCCLAFTASSQSMIQRYLSTETLEQAQNANVLSTIFSAIGQLFSFLAGLVAFAIFYKCDPLKNKDIQNVNQLLPLIVMNAFGNYSGLPGLYFTGLLSASLSTVSSLINSMASVTIESFIRPYFPKISEKSYTKYCKYLAFAYGLISLLGVLVVQVFPNVLQATISIAGAITSPTLGTMLVGLILPQGNRKVSMVAFTIGVVLCLWALLGNLIGNFEETPRVFSVDGCNTTDIFNFTSSYNISNIQYSIATEILPTLESTANLVSSDWTKMVFLISPMSYMWLGTFGVLVSGICTVIGTFMFGPESRDICYPQLVPPVFQNLHKRLSIKWRQRLYCDIYPEEMAEVSGSDCSEHILPLLK
ncbi:Sodium-coupled monocarboxylate transporter 1 [Chamberlinius hualienensis]